MDNLNEMGVVKVTSPELTQINGGGPLKWLAGNLAWEALMLVYECATEHDHPGRTSRFSPQNPYHGV